MRMLSRTLQRSAKERAATKLALEAIDRDYPGSIEITDLIDNPTLEQLAVLLDTADC
jgi:hypothetical protein